MSRIERAIIVSGVSSEIRWWLDRRLKKLRELSHATMGINPFMLPLVVGIHTHEGFDELAEFLLGGHLMGGHSTGFGKLVDEKILPRVFGTTKLDANFRRKQPYSLSVFTEIDHIIHHDDGDIILSLKASRWTIQLTAAMQLNSSFNQLIKLRDERDDVNFSKILVGVYYGTEEKLTDKFSIIRGICSGAQHDVVDITGDVEVVAGRNLWARLNGGEPATQDWVMDGILDGLDRSKEDLKEAAQLIENYKLAFTRNFQQHIGGAGEINWHGILREING